MRELSVKEVTKAVRSLFLNANYDIGRDVVETVTAARETETSETGRVILSQLLENYEIAHQECVPICQDTGMAILFLDIGQDIHFVDGDLNEAIHEGVRQAYREGYLRKSIVTDPLFDRKNTGDNTPALIYPRIVPGEQLRILATAKGFGSENMSAVKMLVPADGVEGVLNFIVDTVRKAGPNPCPPIVIGVGIGGSMDAAAVTAKRMTARPLGSHNIDERYAELEKEALRRVNCLGIGPAGTGGNTTALAVNIDWMPTHIAGMPVAINICCHAARHMETVL